jgi:hypothetical protein
MVNGSHRSGETSFTEAEKPRGACPRAGMGFQEAQSRRCITGQLLESRFVVGCLGGTHAPLVIAEHNKTTLSQMSGEYRKGGVPTTRFCISVLAHARKKDDRWLGTGLCWVGQSALQAHAVGRIGEGNLRRLNVIGAWR